MVSTSVYLSLGGNEGEVLLRIQQSLDLLSSQPGISNLKFSHFYRTAPLYVNSLSWFVNAVCSFQTILSLKDLFEITQAIEIQLGKIAKPKNAARPIDIDVLFYGQQTSQDSDLEIPHPRWQERLFILIPLQDLTSEIFINGPKGLEHYLLQDLIQPLLGQTDQTVSLLEKNPSLQ